MEATSVTLSVIPPLHLVSRLDSSFLALSKGFMHGLFSFPDISPNKEAASNRD